MLSSGGGILCYNEGKRYILGQTYIGKNSRELTLEIENNQLYYEIEKNSPFIENLIISIPALDRSEAIEINKRLKNSYYDKIEKKFQKE